MRRYELTDAEYELVRELLPAAGPRGGRPWRAHRQVLDGLMWVLHTGAQWRELPERYGPWKTAYGRLRRWRRDGTFDRVLARLHVRLDRAGRIDWDLFGIDGTSVRASRSAAGARRTGGSPRTSPATTRWVAREAGGARSSTWSLTVAEFPWPRRSRPGRRTSRSRSSR
jgi:transposase